MARAIGQREEGYNYAVLFDDGSEIIVGKEVAGPHPTWRKLAELAQAGAFDAPETKPVTLTIVSGDAQVANAKTALAEPFVVRVTNRTRLPIAGAAVTFTVATGGGSVDGNPVLTDAAGLAHSGSVTVGAGANTVSAVAVVPPSVPVAPLATRTSGSVTFTASGVAVPVATAFTDNPPRIATFETA